MSLVHPPSLHKESAIYSAVVITASEDMFLTVKEFLKHTKCSVKAQTASVPNALQYLYSGSANLLIIDDSNEHPSTATVREIISDPIGMLTPMLVILMAKNANETIHLSHLAKTKVTHKPITPSSFPAAYQKLISIWSDPQLQAIKEKTKLSLASNLGERVLMLQSLPKHADTACFVARAIALNLQKMGKIKEAEGVLLEQMKKNSHDIGLLTTLGHFYLMSAMPSIANKIFLKILSKFPDSTIAIPDLIQSHIIMEEYEKTIDLFQTLIKKDYLPQQTSRQLARILHVSGRSKDASYLLVNQPNAYRLFENKWKEILGDPLEKVS